MPERIIARNQTGTAAVPGGITTGRPAVAALRPSGPIRHVSPGCGLLGGAPLPPRPESPRSAALRRKLDRLGDAGAVRVDREAKILYGVVLARPGPLSGREGAFDREGLWAVARLAREHGPLGLKCRWTHPPGAYDADPLDLYLGRMRSPRYEGDRVRADLHLSPVCFHSPRGDLGKYVLDRAALDPSSLSSSLVLNYHLDGGGFIRPNSLFASDLVCRGAAVGSLLEGYEGEGYGGGDYESPPAAALRRKLLLLGGR